MLEEKTQLQLHSHFINYYHFTFYGQAAHAYGLCSEISTSISRLATIYKNINNPRKRTRYISRSAGVAGSCLRCSLLHNKKRLSNLFLACSYKSDHEAPFISQNTIFIFNEHDSNTIRVISQNSLTADRARHHY